MPEWATEVRAERTQLRAPAVEVASVSTHIAASSLSGALSYSTIVYATIFTVVIWDEKLSPLAWIGMVVIVASGLLALRAEKKELQKEAGFES